ncbi:MAG: precorrin-8X methylmutase [Eubacterium sp.]|nr:precorrin-8X methylmutase [Eubacterium sp.]
MKYKHLLPADIERTSMRIIEEELAERGIEVTDENLPVVRRVIHTSADFDYGTNLVFTENATTKGIEAMLKGSTIITDTNMALSGITKPTLKKLGGQAFCFMAEPKIAEKAKVDGTTRAVASVSYASEKYPNAVFAVGNAPTALIKLSELIREGLRPSLVIGVPVGFVNVVESKEEIFELCKEKGIPAIVAKGRKGGSNVAASICNALLYAAGDQTDPGKRGWQG